MKSKRIRNKAHRPSQRGLSFISNLIGARHGLGDHHNKMALKVRMMREVLKAQRGTADTWVEIISLLNVCALKAQYDERKDWYNTLATAAAAMKSIEERVRRTGGSYMATELELELIDKALNLVDEDIMPRMRALEWNNLSHEMMDNYKEMERKEKHERTPSE